jgi:hypothetical protein
MADASRLSGYRVKGELERDVREIGFRSLAILRPSIIEGERDEVRLAESLVRSFHISLRPSFRNDFGSIPPRKSPKCSSMRAWLMSRAATLDTQTVSSDRSTALSPMPPTTRRRTRGSRLATIRATIVPIEYGSGTMLAEARAVKNGHYDRFGNFRLLEILLDGLSRKVASTLCVISRFSRSIFSYGSRKYPRTCRNETDIVTAWRSMK